MSTGDCLSIDFGSYRIRAVYLAPETKSVEFKVGEPFLAAEVFVDERGTVCFGREEGVTEQQVPSCSRYSVARILERIDSPVPVLVGSFTDASRPSFTARALFVALLRHIRKVSEKQAGHPFQIAAAALPAHLYRSVAHMKVLRELFARAGFEDAVLCDDATSVQCACGAPGKAPAETVLVIDWNYSALRAYIVGSSVEGPFADASLGGDTAVYLTERSIGAGFTPARRRAVEEALIELATREKVGGLDSKTLVENVLGPYADRAADFIVSTVRSRLSAGECPRVHMLGLLCKLLNLAKRLESRGLRIASVRFCSGDEMAVGALRYATERLESRAAIDRKNAALDTFALETRRVETMLKICREHLANGTCGVWFGDDIPEHKRKGARAAFASDQRIVLLCDCTYLFGDGKLGFVVGPWGIDYRCKPGLLDDYDGSIPWSAIGVNGVRYDEGSQELVVHDGDRKFDHCIDVGSSLADDAVFARKVVAVIQEIANAFNVK